MGIIINVYRRAGDDYSNGGISAIAERLCVVNVDGPFEPDYNIPAVMLTTNQLGNPVIKPARKDFGMDWSVQPGHFMMGGNYGATSDSRFFGAVNNIAGHTVYGAIPIHDRQE